MIKVDKITTRKVFGKRIVPIQGVFTPTREMLTKAAKIILDQVVFEAKKDMALSRSMAAAGGHQVLLPKSEDFIKSFSASVEGSVIHIKSSWPLIEQHIEGRDPYPMTWLTQAEGVKKVPMITREGISVVRTTPLTTNEAWYHPGFKKFTFLERGARKGREKARVYLLKEMLPYMLKEAL
jgi:hypothetical protein